MVSSLAARLAREQHSRPKTQHLPSQRSANQILLDLSTHKWRQLADKMGTIGYMTWSRDSQYVAFDTAFTADPAFYRVQIADGEVRRILSLNNIRRFFSQWGEWSGLAPDGSPLLVRDISTQEIYALDWKLP
jgi:Tol biopolymer transport system component